MLTLPSRDSVDTPPNSKSWKIHWIQEEIGATYRNGVVSKRLNQHTERTYELASFYPTWFFSTAARRKWFIVSSLHNFI